jgi:hypothetical protein
LKNALKRTKYKKRSAQPVAQQRGDDVFEIWRLPYVNSRGIRAPEPPLHEKLNDAADQINRGEPLRYALDRSFVEHCLRMLAAQSLGEEYRKSPSKRRAQYAAYLIDHTGCKRQEAVFKAASREDRHPTKKETAAVDRALTRLRKRTKSR